MAWTPEEAARVGRLEDKIDETFQTVKAIDQALRGWEGNGGLLREVETLKREKIEMQAAFNARLQLLEDREKDRKVLTRAVGAAWGAASGAGLTIILFIIQHYWH